MKITRNTIIFILLSLLVATLLIYILLLLSSRNQVETFGLWNTEETEKYTAIIIEPRKHKALGYVLENFLENLDDRWDVILFHGTLNKEYSEDIIKNKLQRFKHRIQLINLNVENLASLYEYSAIFYDPDFYDHIPTEVFLVFQTDTIICSKFKDYINEFIQYDYVGAPVGWSDGGKVGNGGLSLRRKSKMLEILEKCPNRNDVQNTYEDNYFSFACDEIRDYNIPTVEDAKNFAIEKMMNTQSFGLHKAYAYNDVDTIKQWCPEVSKLQQLQGVVS